VSGHELSRTSDSLLPVLQGYETNLQTQRDAAMQLVHAQDYSNRNLRLLKNRASDTKCAVRT
jgi:hypothetical protein